MKLEQILCECGWQSKPGSPARVAYSARQHSCAKQLRLAAIRANGDALRASVDRTPKPCLHKRANHQHGTHAAYVLDHCRCRPCATANTTYEGHRARQTAYGRWQPFLDAEPVRAHVRNVMAAGIGLKRIAVLAGVSSGAMSKLMYGSRQPDGTHRPSAKLRADTARKLLAVEPSLDLYADGAKVPITGTQRRLQALVAIGWPLAKLATELEFLPTNFGKVVHAGNQSKVLLSTARDVRALYERMSMTFPPEDTHRQKISAARARNFAQARGWLPPLAWDDIDDPDEQPGTVTHLGDDDYLDHAAIERRMAGDRAVKVTKAEATDICNRMRRRGHSDSDIYRRTGLKVERYVALQRDMQEAS